MLFFLFSQELDCYGGKGVTYYTIHGASYQKLGNALNNINELKTLGYESYYRKVNIPGKGIWYRVYIGRYADRDEALTVARKLKARHIVDMFTLQEYGSQAISGVLPTKERRTPPSNSSGVQTSGDVLPGQDSHRGRESTGPHDQGKSFERGERVGMSEKPVPVVEKPSPDQPGKVPLPAVDKTFPGGGLYETALRHFDAGRYEQALDIFKELNRQKLDPENKEKVLMRLADCSYYLGEKGAYRQFLAAVDYYKDILGRYTDQREGNPLVYYRLALSYEKLKFYYEALGIFEKLIAKYPDSPYVQEATFKAGMMLRETRKFAKAIERLSAYLKKYPDGQYARVAAFSIGDCYYQMRQKDNAEAWYAYVQKKWPTFGETPFKDIPQDASRNFGNHALQMRRFADAADAFSRYVSLYPGDENNKNMVYTLAGSYMEMNQFDAAVKLFSHVIERYPGSKEAQEAVFMLATIGVTNPGMKFPSFMAGINNYYDPITTYDGLLAKSPTGNLAERLLFQKALALETYGKNKEAFDTYVLLLKQFPRGKYQDEGRKNLARNVTLLIDKYYETGDDVAVADIYFRVFAAGLMKNGDPEVLWKSGTSLKKIGLYDEATIAFSDMAKSPRDIREETKLLLMLADLDRLRGKENDAEEKLLGLLKKSAKDVEGLKGIKLFLADIYYRKKLYEKAIPLYAEALGSGKDATGGTALDYLNYATALSVKNMAVPAVANYQMAIKDYNSNRQQYSPDVAAKAYLGLGDSLYQGKKYQEGLPMYQQAFTVAREQNYKWWSLYHVGQGYMKLNNTTMAEASFNQLKENGKGGFWEKVPDYWLEDSKWYDKNIRYLK